MWYAQGMDASSSTEHRIMDTAQLFMQTRGYNAFSYADIAERVGIRTASIHYHFPTKGDLAHAVVARYRAEMREQLRMLDSTASSPQRKLERYADLYRTLAQEGVRMCLCGLLAAEEPTLPEAVRIEVRGYYTDNEAWLEQVIREGEAQRAFRVNGPVAEAAQTVLALIEGAMLSARALGDPARFDVITRRLLTSLTAPE